MPIRLIIDSAPTAYFQASITSRFYPLTSLSLSTRTCKTGVITSFVYYLAPGPSALAILVISERQVFKTALFLSTSPAFRAPNNSESPLGKIQFLASAITSSTLSYPSFLIFQFVFLSFSINFELLSSLDTSTQGRLSSKEAPPAA